MAIQVTTTGKTTLFLDDKPFGKGGEGAIHRVLKPASYAGQCVKLYGTEKIAHERKNKVFYQIAHQLPQADPAAKPYVICWPTEAVFQNNRFAGFVMLKADDGSEDLEKLCIPRMRDLGPLWQRKYGLDTPGGLQARLKLCVNIALAVHAIHSGECVFVDLKPSNFRIAHNGKVFVTDLDSLQVVPQGSNRGCFHARVLTPDHAPPESAHLVPKTDVIDVAWDYFSLAVLFYRVIFGVHPFAASFHGPAGNSATIEEAIHKGYFVYGRQRSAVLKRSERHDTFERLPQSLQSLFRDALDSGHLDPQRRPCAEQWGQAIFSTIRSGTQIMPVSTKPVVPPPAITPGSIISASNKSSAPRYRRGAVVILLFLVVLTAAVVILILTMQPASAVIIPTDASVAVERLVATPTPVSDAPGAAGSLPVPTLMSSGSVAGYSRVQIQDTNLRAQPDPDAPVIAILRRGVDVYVLGDTQQVDTSTWVTVQRKDVVGWVNARYITQPVPQTLDNTGRARVAGTAPERLLIRNAPDQQSEVVDRLSEGAEVTLRSVYDDGTMQWWLIEVDQTTGWANAAYLQQVEP